MWKILHKLSSSPLFSIPLFPAFVTLLLVVEGDVLLGSSADPAWVLEGVELVHVVRNQVLAVLLPACQTQKVHHVAATRVPSLPCLQKVKSFIALIDNCHYVLHAFLHLKEANIIIMVSVTLVIPYTAARHNWTWDKWELLVACALQKVNTTNRAEYYSDSVFSILKTTTDFQS